MRLPDWFFLVAAGILLILWSIGIAVILCASWGATGWKATALILILIDMFMIPAWIDWKAGHQNE
jgi:hypothetical protein